MKHSSSLLLLAVFASVIALAYGSRVVLERDARLVPAKGWTLLGKPAPSEPHMLIIAIKQRNLDVLAKELDAVAEPKSAKYGQYWTIEKINELVRPDPRSYKVIKQWLGDEVQFELSTPDFARVYCTIAQAEQLLQVTYSKFQSSETGRVVNVALQHYSVPAEVAPHIDLVGGVFRFPRQSQNKPMVEVSLGTPTTPELIQKMYNVTIPTTTKNLQAVASFLEQYYSPSDLSKFESTFGLPQVPIQSTLGYNNPNLPGVEASLDVQYLLGVGNCTIDTWVYSTNGTQPYGNEPFLDFLQTLDNSSVVPNLISMSYQDLEYTVTLDYANRCNAEFMKNTMRGITFITGSGDWGVGCEDSEHCTSFTSDFPSCSPYVVSTGATTLNNVEHEEGVAFSSGGFSNYFGQPSYQTAAIQAYINLGQYPSTSLWNQTGRGFPDVAAIGTAFQVYYKGRDTPVQGTSASTPTFGSLLSMINSLRINAGLPTLGWVQPFLYQAWAANPRSFQDITTGQPQAKGCCSASFKPVVGWDPYTGLGTPNFGVLASLAMDKTFFNFNN